MNNRLAAFGGLFLLVVLFFAFNLWAGRATRNVRVDLTQGKLYTLSQGSKNIAKSFDEPVTLTLYYSARAAQGRPQVQAYATRVRELIEQYAELSGGKIQFKVIDPQAYSDEEDEAAAAGLQGAQVGPNQSLYFGLVGTNTLNGKEVIPIFNPDSERFLEYDISRMLYTLGHPKKRVVGVISPLQLDGMAFDPQTMQPVRRQPWQIMTELRGIFEVKMLGTNITDVPADIDVLLVVHPKGLSESVLYAIDQYVLKGGKMVACVDPMCEVDEVPQDPRNPMAAMMARKDSTLGKLFDAWGVAFDTSKIVGDETFAIPVTLGSQGRQEPVSYIAWLGLANNVDAGRLPLNKEDATTGLLSRVNLATAGAFSLAGADKPEATAPAPSTPAEAPKTEPPPKAGEGGADFEQDAPPTATEAPNDQPATPAGEVPPTTPTPTPSPDPAPAAPAPMAEAPAVTLLPLIESSTDSELFDSSLIQFRPDPKALLSNFKSADRKHTIAARVALAPGRKLPSAFPEGRPGATAPGEPAQPPGPDAKKDWIAESAGPVNVVIISDVDFLHDRFWVERDMFGRPVKIADNGDFLVNVVDNLSGSSDLIGIRARGEFTRPFDRVVALQKAAEQKYLAEQQALQDKLTQAQEKITQLEQSRGKDQQNLLLTPEQVKELQKFQDEASDTRKQLRKVQANLNSEIDALGGRLKLINIGLVPLLVTIGAIGLGAYRVSQRKVGTKSDRSAS